MQEKIKAFYHHDHRQHENWCFGSFPIHICVGFLKIVLLMLVQLLWYLFHQCILRHSEIAFCAFSFMCARMMLIFFRCLSLRNVVSKVFIWQLVQDNNSQVRILLGFHPYNISYGEYPRLLLTRLMMDNTIDDKEFSQLLLSLEIRGKLSSRVACMRLQATRQWCIKPGVYCCAIYSIFQSLDVTFVINSLPWSLMTVLKTPNGVMCLTIAY